MTTIDDETVKRRIEGRLVRQETLRGENPPEFWAVIDEAACRKLVGGAEVMCEQLRHLVEVAAQPHITIQIVPNSVDAHAAMAGPFELLDFASEQDPSVVYLETATDSLHLEKPGEIQAYSLTFNRVVAIALSPEESVEYLAVLMDQLRE
ncbi:DUF5753 domain-containing protein [Streptosporangium subroseum]|uniref:DUF5753 domain-containing protein n=1 Tax=Streptosporangium subroseum TaxID=106412 RepID=UPI00343ACF3C